MNEEQIKQNAKSYADVFGRHMADYYGVKDAFTAGAHSRDEEIEELKESKRKLRLRLMQQIHELRNPWISVEERMPEDGEIVLTHILRIIDGAGEHKEDDDFVIQRYRKKFITDRMEQHRIDGYLFDTISKVTHWMPIPELKKGE